jgi:hypothetical protein
VVGYTVVGYTDVTTSATACGVPPATDSHDMRCPEMTNAPTQSGRGVQIR